MFGEVEKVIDRNRYESLADALASVDDLQEVTRALIRENVIREAMAQTGESREIISQSVDAVTSMGQEAVLDLTEGHPTTLADALSRYIDEIPEMVKSATGEVWERVSDDLTFLLTYPWPGPCEDPCSACQPDAEDLTQELYRTWVRVAPRFGVQIVPWTDLEPYQREITTAVVYDLMVRGILGNWNAS